jgi:hypothetical protein
MSRSIDRQKSFNFDGVCEWREETKNLTYLAANPGYVWVKANGLIDEPKRLLFNYFGCGRVNVTGTFNKQSVTYTEVGKVWPASSGGLGLQYTLNTVNEYADDFEVLTCI